MRRLLSYGVIAALLLLVLPWGHRLYQAPRYHNPIDPAAVERVELLTGTTPSS